MVAQITPVQRQRRVRPSSPAFAHADILSRFGETICICVEVPRHALAVVSTVIVTQTGGAEVPPIEAAHGACEFDEDPERWDGLS